MTQRLTQAEVEARMFHGGVKRAEAVMSRAEDKGRAHTNPYAKGIMRDFVLPLAEAVDQTLAQYASTAPESQPAHALLLAGLDTQAVAFLTVRTIMSCCLGAARETNHRAVAAGIGGRIRDELVLQQIAAQSPELYETVARDLGRRLSKDERHRMTVFKLQARENGIEYIQWPLGGKEQVGMFLLGLCAVLGLVDIEPHSVVHNKARPRQVTLSFDVLQEIDQVKEHIALTTPVFGPCVEPPIPWTGWYGGGYHTPELRRSLPCLVRAHPSLRPLYAEPAPVVWAAVNALQNTAWEVNSRLLDTVLDLARAGVRCEEIVSVEGPPAPPRPNWLPASGKANVEEMSPEQQAQFRAWKTAMRDWYEARKLAGAKYARFYAATRAAEMFRGYPELYFVYFADSRGRLYPLTYGLSPQGSDLQKALLKFANGRAKPLLTAAAVRWFKINGANLWGFDKAPLADRAAWADEHGHEALAYAAAPLDNTGWLQADKPLQFLAWCFEYAEWRADPQGFRSALPVGQDGSCNGLQHLSAMLRDEVGGAAVNLVSSAQMQDIYRLVADASRRRMVAAVPPEGTPAARYRALWLQHGIERSAVKRPVMTTPYGVTLGSAIKYVQEDYLKHVPNPFQPQEYRAAAQYLMSHAWPAIGDILVKGSVAMKYLKAAGRTLAKTQVAAEDPIIAWDTPSGFPAGQAYFEYDEVQITTRLAGKERIRVKNEHDTPDPTKHAAGLAPNFVHSLDAAHLHLTTAAFSACCIDASLAMVHDSYGTTAADSELLAKVLREEFVKLYTNNDPLQELRNRYQVLPAPPDKGGLDIAGVLSSDFFFS